MQIVSSIDGESKRKKKMLCACTKYTHTHQAQPTDVLLGASSVLFCLFCRFLFYCFFVRLLFWFGLVLLDFSSTQVLCHCLAILHSVCSVHSLCIPFIWSEIILRQAKILRTCLQKGLGNEPMQTTTATTTKTATNLKSIDQISFTS